MSAAVYCRVLIAAKEMVAAVAGFLSIKKYPKGDIPLRMPITGVFATRALSIGLIAD